MGVPAETCVGWAQDTSSMLAHCRTGNRRFTWRPYCYLHSVRLSAVSPDRLNARFIRQASFLGSGKARILSIPKTGDRQRESPLPGSSCRVCVLFCSAHVFLALTIPTPPPADKVLNI